MNCRLFERTAAKVRLSLFSAALSAVAAAALLPAAPVLADNKPLVPPLEQPELPVPIISDDDAEVIDDGVTAQGGSCGGGGGNYDPWWDCHPPLRKGDTQVGPVCDFASTAAGVHYGGGVAHAQMALLASRALAYYSFTKTVDGHFGSLTRDGACKFSEDEFGSSYNTYGRIGPAEWERMQSKLQRCGSQGPEWCYRYVEPLRSYTPYFYWHTYNLDSNFNKRFAPWAADIRGILTGGEDLSTRHGVVNCVLKTDWAIYDASDKYPRWCL